MLQAESELLLVARVSVEVGLRGHEDLASVPAPVGEADVAVDAGHVPVIGHVQVDKFGRLVAEPVRVLFGVALLRCCFELLEASLVQRVDVVVEAEVGDRSDEEGSFAHVEGDDAIGELLLPLPDGGEELLAEPVHGGVFDVRSSSCCFGEEAAEGREVAFVLLEEAREVERRLSPVVLVPGGGGDALLAFGLEVGGVLSEVLVRGICFDVAEAVDGL